MNSFIYEICCLNFQNDRIWALNIDHIPQEMKVLERLTSEQYFDVFMMSSAKRLILIFKEQEQACNGGYFWEVVLIQHVLRCSENVLSFKETTFLHDRAPYMSNLAKQNQNAGEDHLLTVAKMFQKNGVQPQIVNITPETLPDTIGSSSSGDRWVMKYWYK